MQIRSSYLRMFCLIGGLAVLVTPAVALADIEWVPIGDAGNPSDSQPQGSYGSVGYEYAISKYEITNSQYAAFLNARAAADPLELYHPSMGSHAQGGILRFGSSGNYTYDTVAGFEDKPVIFVSFYDALRFANWLDNGEGNGSTETGAYTLLGGTAAPSNGSTVQRNHDAAVVLPTQNEWFKAAYYDGPSDTYFDYPTWSDTEPDCGSPSDTVIRANCGTSGLTEVGAYTASPSPYETFDQGGNVQEWNESPPTGARRSVRGGGWTSLSRTLKASSVGTFPATNQLHYLGFRLVVLDPDVIPEPDASLLGLVALSSLSLLRRHRAGRVSRAMKSG